MPEGSIMARNAPSVMILSFLALWLLLQPSPSLGFGVLYLTNSSSTNSDLPACNNPACSQSDPCVYQSSMTFGDAQGCSLSFAAANYASAISISSLGPIQISSSGTVFMHGLRVLTASSVQFEEANITFSNGPGLVLVSSDVIVSNSHLEFGQLANLDLQANTSIQILSSGLYDLTPPTRSGIDYGNWSMVGTATVLISNSKVYHTSGGILGTLPSFTCESSSVEVWNFPVASITNFTDSTISGLEGGLFGSQSVSSVDKIIIQSSNITGPRILWVTSIQPNYILNALVSANALVIDDSHLSYASFANAINEQLSVTGSHLLSTALDSFVTSVTEVVITGNHFSIDKEVAADIKLNYIRLTSSDAPFYLKISSNAFDSVIWDLNSAALSRPCDVQLGLSLTTDHASSELTVDTFCVAYQVDFSGNLTVKSAIVNQSPTDPNTVLVGNQLSDPLVWTFGSIEYNVYISTSIPIDHIVTNPLIGMFSSDAHLLNLNYVSAPSPVYLIMWDASPGPRLGSSYPFSNNISFPNALPSASSIDIGEWSYTWSYDAPSFTMNFTVVRVSCPSQCVHINHSMCIEVGACPCNPGWSGLNCDVLLPATPSIECGIAPIGIPGIICLNGFWTLPSNSTEQPPAGVSIFSPVVIQGGLDIPGTLTFHGLGASLTVGQCFHSQQLEVTLTDPDLETLSKASGSKSTTLLTQSGNGCPSSLTLPVTLNQPKSCKKASMKTTTNNQASSSSLVATFTISTIGCKVWWIVLASVLGGIVILVVIAMLLVTFVTPLKKAVRPFWVRKHAKTSTSSTL